MMTQKTEPKFLYASKTANGLTVFFSGHDPISVAKQNGLYGEIEAKLRSGQTENLYELADFASRIKSHSKGKFTVIEEDGKDYIFLYNHKMPTALSSLVFDFVSQGFNTDFIERFWKNLCLNPSEESRQSLYGFIEANNMTLTDDGCFIGYRSIRNDWKDLRTGTMDNSIGASPSMPRDEVDPDPNNTCSRGLHIAAWDYASQFGYGNSRLVEVKVNPRDVVTVPPDYNNQKMRVCKFTVLSEVVQKRDSLVHPDTFSDPSDWDDSLTNDVEVDDVEVDDATAVDSETFVLTITSTGGVNLPKELVVKAGFKVGDEAHICLDDFDGTIKVYPSCCGISDACSKRTVDYHNSIRLGSGLFEDWAVAGDNVEATIANNGSVNYIEIV